MGKLYPLGMSYFPCRPHRSTQSLHTEWAQSSDRSHCLFSCCQQMGHCVVGIFSSRLGERMIPRASYYSIYCWSTEFLCTNIPLLSAHQRCVSGCRNKGGIPKVVCPLSRSAPPLRCLDLYRCIFSVGPTLCFAPPAVQTNYG